MRFLFLFLVNFFILISNVAFADVSFKANDAAEKKFFSKRFQFYRVPFKSINQTPLKKYCDFPLEKAELYLKTKEDMAQIDATAAYHYGTLIGFAPCLENDFKSAIIYLKMASDNGNKEAAYLLGTIYLKRNDLNMAKKYFIKAARSFHPEANYNYALLESRNFKYINQLTLSLLKNAANSGNLKAQHDQSIVILKLFLNNKIKLKQREIVQLSNIFNNIVNNTDDNLLKARASQNLNNFLILTKRLIVKQSPVHHARIMPDVMHAKQQINFERLEAQSINAFNDDNLNINR